MGLLQALGQAGLHVLQLLPEGTHFVALATDDALALARCAEHGVQVTLVLLVEERLCLRVEFQVEGFFRFVLGSDNCRNVLLGGILYLFLDLLLDHRIRLWGGGCLTVQVGGGDVLTDEVKLAVLLHFLLGEIHVKIRH
jgi:hypothetical protein